MMKKSKQDRFLLEPHLWKRALEASFLCLLLLFTLTRLPGLGEEIFQFYVFAIIGLVSSLWFAGRLKINQSEKKQRRSKELVAGILLTLLISLIVWLPAYLLGWVQKVNEDIFPVSIILNIPFFLFFRFSIRIWRRWNQLRRERLAWSMTSTILSAVLLGSSILVPFLIFAVISENIPEDAQTMDWIMANLISFVIPNSIGIILVILIVLIVLILPPALLISYRISKRITARLESLEAAALALQEGDYSIRSDVNGEDEIARLQNDFNVMAQELQQSRHELQTERDKVSSLLKTQRELTANISHELRTPVAVIQGYLEPVLKQPEETPLQDLKNDLQIIERESEHLNRLINDLFTLSQAEVGKLTLQPAPTNLTELIKKTASTFSKLAWQRSRVEIVTEIDQGTPLVALDGMRLEQILSNLIRNSIRHTPPGGIIAIRLSVQTRYALIEVKDTGEGIPSDELQNIWERFYRASGSQASNETGAGLGLTVVKELTEAMNGTVSVQSQPGQGTTFTLAFPFEENNK